jgi:hypothetical protein
MFITRLRSARHWSLMIAFVAFIVCSAGVQAVYADKPCPSCGPGATIGDRDLCLLEPQTSSEIISSATLPEPMFLQIIKRLISEMAVVNQERRMAIRRKKLPEKRSQKSSIATPQQATPTQPVHHSNRFNQVQQLQKQPSVTQ